MPTAMRSCSASDLVEKLASRSSNSRRKTYQDSDSDAVKCIIAYWCLKPVSNRTKERLAEKAYAFASGEINIL